jgi:hypothetical protein
MTVGWSGNGRRVSMRVSVMLRANVDGDQTIGKVLKPALEVWSPLSYWGR